MPRAKSDSDELEKSETMLAEGSGSGISVVPTERSTGLLDSSPSADGSSPGSATAPHLIASRYAILGLVGRGGMGAVYRARDTELDEIVALKVLKPELGDSPHLIERFKREVKLARRVTHPNVARMYDIGEHAGTKFLTMEFISGEPLTDLVERQGRLSIGRTLEIAAAMCEGLAAAHKAGVVHRDLKPDNVMVTPEGRVVITDFGIARDPMAAGAANTLGGVLGTPAYMSPEQVEAKPDIDARADIYALGVMLFELFTGELPFKGPSVLALAAARLYSPAPPAIDVRPDLPPALSAVVARCLARMPEDRFADAEQVAAALASASPTLQAGATRRTSTLPGSRPNPLLHEKTVAVLPFRNLGTSEDDFVADGLTDELIDTLSMTQGLRVRPRGTVMQFKGRDVDPRQIGRELGVEVVVEGSIRRASNRIRLTARLTSVEDGFQLWAKRFDRPANDLLVVNDETARAIADALTVHGIGPKHVAPTDAVAVDLYLKARAELRLHWPDHVIHAIDLLRAAHDRAPRDIAILSAYARASSRLWFFRGDSEPHAANQARSLSEQAVLMAPDEPAAQLALATVRLMDSDPRAAAEAIRRAMVRGSHEADVLEFFARLVLETGPPTLAIERLEEALQLDPDLSNARLELARAHALLGDRDKAISILDEVPKNSPANAGQLVLRARLVMWFPELLDGMKNVFVPEEIPPASPWRVVQFVKAVANGKSIDDDLAFFDVFIETTARSARFASIIRQLVTEFYSHFGRLDEALAQIEGAIGTGLFDLNWADRCPALANLRADPRFATSRAVIADRAKTVRNALGI